MGAPAALLDSLSAQLFGLCSVTHGNGEVMEHSSQVREAELPPITAPVTGPFVVNLCASVAPIEIKGSNLPGLERYRLYQVRRLEDNRPRYRLRLGFFTDEAATESVLNAVREFYPAAFCVPAGIDDLKHAPGFDGALLAVAPAKARQPAAPARSTETTGRYPRPSIPAAPATKPAPAIAPKPAAPATAPVAAAAALELLPEPAPRAAPAHAATPAAGPFRIRAADPAVLRQSPLELKLDSDRPAGKSASDHGIAPPRLTDAPILIDSTQTLRMLTEAELSDNEGPQWFALQLAVSDQAINLDTMPKLDIFAAFRLYSIATPQQGKIIHSLRLGFFKEKVSAEAVAGYLKTFFNTPDVLRVSGAEQARFADPPKPPVLQETAHGTAKVVPLNDARVRAGKTIPPAAVQKAAPAVAKPPPAAQVKPVPAKPAAPAKVAAPAKKGPPGKRAAVRNRSLNELLHEEAREVELSESGIRRMEQKGSLLSRLVGKLTR